MQSSEIAVISVSGVPRARGEQYARALGDSLPAFVQTQVRDYFARAQLPWDQFLNYAERCLESTARHLPDLLGELEGMASVSGVSVVELLACLAHEEAYHLAKFTRLGNAPKPGHCVCFAMGAGESGSGRPYCGQTWDWMQCMQGQSRFLRSQDSAGRHTLYYGYPAIPYGAGMNEAGLALVWMSGGLWEKRAPVPGIPDYALIYGILRQPSIAAAWDWLADKPIAGWFCFILCDTQGEVACFEGAPGLVRATRSRAYLGRQCYYHHPDLIAATGQDRSRGILPPHGREGRMLQLLAAGLGRTDDAYLQTLLRDDQPGGAISYGPPANAGPDAVWSIDAFYFDPANARAQLARGHAATHTFTSIPLRG